MARWTSSIAPVLRGQLVSMLSAVIITTMTGQRSRAEMKAKDFLSEVAYGATGTSTLDPILAVLYLLWAGCGEQLVGLGNLSISVCKSVSVR